MFSRKGIRNMLAIEVEDAPRRTEEATNEIEGIEIGEGGKVFISLPHLSDMTAPDRAKVLEWYIKEGDVVTQGHDEVDMILLDFLGDDWWLPIPPLNGPMRVAKIEAEVGKVIHLNDPLIVFEPVQDAA
jgi:hypothetical protein